MLTLFQFIFEAEVEGLPKVTKVNTQARRFGPVKVFVGDPWYPAVSGLIKNLNIKTIGGACPTPHGGMVSKDVPLDGGWIHILCNSGGQVGRAGCIFIHKVRAGCTGGNPIDAQMHLVSLNMNEGGRLVSK